MSWLTIKIHRYPILTSKRFTLRYPQCLFFLSFLLPKCIQEIDYIEYFAGMGRITCQMKSRSYRAARLDILDHTPGKNTKKSNYMDLSCASGYAFLWPQMYSLIWFSWVWGCVTEKTPVEDPFIH